MSDPDHDTLPPEGPQKIESESLALRARPRRVAQFNRRVVIGVAAGACVLVFAATMIALYPPSLNRGQSGAELLNTDRKQVAVGSAGLPRGYGDLAPKPAPPKLGPPLPGDLGPPVTHTSSRISASRPQPPQNFGSRPTPEEDANRPERMRLARQAQRCCAQRRWPRFVESQTSRSARRTRCFVVRPQGRQ
jgi:type IV secretory pathway VirB10-like protein